MVPILAPPKHRLTEVGAISHESQDTEWTSCERDLSLRVSQDDNTEVGRAPGTEMSGVYVRGNLNAYKL